MAGPDTDQLYWDWNPERSDVAAAAPTADAPTSPQVTHWRPDPVPTIPIVNFTIHRRDETNFDPDATVGLLPTIEPDSASPDEVPPARGADGGPGAPFPVAGDGIAGFRLISELGRGAFGRVFLAEEALLGNRLVALKVTRAEGDEPRLLARLQHTHIVPIHSVRDDPRTNLRVMCMPYVGGANLAQVLDAAAPSHGKSADRRSLLRALDIVGLPPPSESAVGADARRRADAAPARSVASARREATCRVPRDPARRDLLAPDPGPDQAPEPVEAPPSLAWRTLLSQIPRWSRSIAAPGSWMRQELPPTDAADRDPAQPARRFLREASFVRAAAWIAARLAEGLEHAHAHGLLHRDLKPSNILIAADGTPMLLDFNLAADSTGLAAEVDRVRIGGTLPYMAPEHLDAFHPEGTTPIDRVDERSDTYALGLILFEMVAGRRPFSEPDPGRPILETIRGMIAERQAGAPALRSILPDIPTDLDAVVRKCLHPDPDRRYAHAGDLAEDLRRFLDDRPLKFAVDPSLRCRALKWLRRNPRATGASTVGLLSLVLMLGLGVAAWSVSRHLQAASARLNLQGFEARFPECQFLLNTGGGPAQSLGRGITLAEEVLAQAGVSLGPDRGRPVPAWLDMLPDGDRDEARRDLAEVILLLARARTYLVGQGHSPDGRRAVAAVIPWLDRAERIDPSPTVALYEDRASYHERLGNARRAAEDRARARATPPATGRDFYLIGTALLSQGDPDRAEAALNKATGLTPRSFWPWFALGLCHFEQRRFTEAAGDFAVCAALEPRFAWPWMNRGLALAQLGRLPEARAAYDRALEVDGSLTDALANRGLIALELGDAPAAALDLGRAVASTRRDVGTRAALGEALGRSGRVVEARSLLDALVAEQPDAILPRIARGTLRASTDDAAGAEADFRAALKLAPEDPGAHLGLARLRRRSDPRAALEFALQARRFDPNRIDAVELCAWVRGRLGDPEVVADVERLARVPTANRLYNAACSLALYLASRPDPALADRAVGYLRRAIRSGIAADVMRRDPDLDALKAHPAFRELLRSSGGGATP